MYLDCYYTEYVIKKTEFAYRIYFFCFFVSFFFFGKTSIYVHIPILVYLDQIFLGEVEKEVLLVRVKTENLRFHLKS